MSECTGATTWSSDQAHEWGSCGWSLPGTEFSVRSKSTNEALPAGEEGELCYRGRHIMLGYMANPALGQEHLDEIAQKNADAIDEFGWLHSGDKGKVDERGMVRITGRFKELIIGAGGENVAPVPMEDNVKKLCPAISNIMMVGDKRKFNVALVTLKTVGATGDAPGTDTLDKVAAQIAGDGVTTIEQASASDSKMVKAITQAIKDTNADNSCCPMKPAEIQKFTILKSDFSVQTGELTPTFKLKRSEVESKHTPFIDKLYDCKEVYLPYA